MKKSNTTKYLVGKIALFTILLITVYSFADDPVRYVKTTAEGSVIDVPALIKFLVRAVSKGMNNFIESLMPILGMVAALDYTIGYIGMARSKPKEIVTMNLQKFLKYGCIYFLVTNWFGGINLSEQIVVMITSITELLTGGSLDENSIISTMVAVVTRNVTYMWEAPAAMLKDKQIIQFLGFMAMAGLYCTALMIISICAVVIIGELLVETMNLIIMVAFSAMFFVLGLVKGFEGKILHPLQIIFGVFIKYLTVFWLYQILWGCIKGNVESIKMPAGKTDFDPALMLRAMWCAAVVLFAIIIFKLVTRSIMTALNSLMIAE